ncbi:MAG TPA: M23 family metallopeptidase [Chitinophagales bacterium]|nr:M23 family metallopeptidase [Chitinophagales bacterium]
MQKQKIRLLGDTMGLAPFPLRFRQAMVALFGEEDVPPSRWGLSSLSQLYPAVGLKLWRGRPYVKNKVIISNLFNHTQTPIEQGWSVKKTQVLDFRGMGLTYNSHNGTDFAIPIGSTVCTAAPGKVLAVISQYNRGGLKIFIDHGQGLMTCYAHLAKSTVQAGDILHRGQPIAISGYSGLDGTVTFPFGVPHMHFNVWLNGEPVDPFGKDELVSMWNAGELPKPAGNEASSYTPSVYNYNNLQEALECCITTSVSERLTDIVDPEERAAHTIIEMNYYPTRFTKRVNIYEESFERSARLDLPFKGSDFKEVVFLDELLPKRKRQINYNTL